ncbi:unnamed protein product [Mytilus edulis]|uniref:Beta-N-acetylhexosaminidase n=1 Tax=Mytilus edulis TaxID=6550 RepID=A0A8S3Q3T7_MYTED|nr:unnamed protein product [Mytilus edulis]
MTEKLEIIQQLHIAVENDRTDILRAFISTIEQNDDHHQVISNVLNNCYHDDGTLLHVASKLGKIDVVRTLLSSGSDPGIHNSYGKTAVDLAATHNITKVFNEELLQAAAQSNVGRICQLLAAGVDVNLYDSEESKSTPLHWAASFANRDIIQCLCARGADVNQINSQGYTPLHDAIKRGDVEVITELLAYGADSSLNVTAGKDEGKTCKDLAGTRKEIIHALDNPPPLINIEEEFDLGKLSLKTDIGASTETIGMNGTAANGSEPGSPELKTPTFMKTVSFDDMIQPPHPVVTEEKLSLLWPQPQSMLQQETKPFVIRHHLPVYVSGGPAENSIQVMKIVKMRKPSFTSLGLDVSINLLSSLSDTRVPHLQCHVNNRLCPGHGLYKLTISQGQIKMLCSDYSSLHCAISTVYQLMSLYKENEEIIIPGLMIDDWPDLHYRGVLFDASQGRLPNFETLKRMIDTLVGLKINMVQLFCRFLKTQGWQLGYSKSEIMDLVDHCSDLGIQLVPVLEVAPQVQFDELDDIYSTIEDFMTCFTDSQFVSLGPRLSSFVIDTENNVLDVTDAVKLLPLRHNQILNICGYPLHGMDSELLIHLPPDVVISEYGIQADYDFQRFCSPLSSHGISYIMCPGTSAWNSLAGCPEAAINNIFSAVKCGDAHGALGAIVCNWSGKGHLTHLPFAWPGILVLAGLAWNSDCHQDYLYSNLGELLNRHIFKDTTNTIGHVIVELGRAETYLIRCCRGQAGGDSQKLPDEHGSTLFQFFFNPDAVPIEHLTPEALQRSVRHLKKCQQEVLKINLTCKDSEHIKKELSLTCDLMIFSARICKSLLLAGKNPMAGHAGYAVVNLGVSNLPATVKTDLANRLLELMEPYKEVWHKRYVVNVGLSESVGKLQNVFKLLVPGSDSEGLMTQQNHDDQVQHV